MPIERNEGDPATECPKCGRDRVWKIAMKTAITKAGSQTTRWRQYCSPCHSSESYKSRKLNIEHSRVLQMRQREMPAQRAALLFRDAKKRAKKRNLPFDLTLQFCKDMMLNSGLKCSATGAPFDFTLGSGTPKAMAPSMDQINPGMGYVQGNVRFVLWIYNRCKGNGTDEDVMNFAKLLMSFENNHRHSTLGIPKSVGQEFIEKDKE